MTLTQVMDHYALAFGQQPTLRPHGLYPCGGCGGSFATGQVCIVMEPGGGRFLCGPCNIDESAVVPADNQWRVERNAEIVRRVGAGETQAAVGRPLGLTRQGVHSIVQASRGRAL